MLPNSIERTTPIVGYNPYAYIMGARGNFSMQGGRAGNIDYYAKKPENIYGNGEKARKRFNIAPTLKGILAIAVVLIGSAAFLSGKDKIKAAESVTLEPDKLDKAVEAGVSGAKKAGGFIADKARSAGRFISNKFHAASNFIKWKLGRTP